MSLPKLLCLIVLVNAIDSAPDKFRFTSQPTSHNITYTSGTVTLSCEATGRSDITYNWYKHASGFDVPPDLTISVEINGETGTSLTISASDVDDSDDKKLFQCKATAGDELIYSDVARITYQIADDIQFTGTVFSNTVSSGEDLGEGDPFVFTMKCDHDPVGTITSDQITNGKAYNVYWYKGSDNTRVEDNYDNMWTFYGSSTPTETLEADVKDGTSVIASFTRDLSRYDLVIYNIQDSDAGTYTCKAVSENSEVVLGTTTLSVGAESNGYTIETTGLVTGYRVQAVDSGGELKTTASTGDDVLLMCGAVCKSTTGASGGNDVSYQWKYKNQVTILSTNREYTITISSAGQVGPYKCSIVDCGSLTEQVLFTAEGADESTYSFSFTSYSPEYIWYDTADNSSSVNKLQIDCAGSGTSDVDFINTVYKDGAVVATSPPYKFNTSLTSVSDLSGAYQCAFHNNGDNMLWVQKTTEVLIATNPSATITPTAQNIEDAATATFTCIVGGHPVESVVITGPNSLHLNCLTTPSDGDVSCSSSTTDDTNYVIEISTFALDEDATYTCTVTTNYWNSNTSAEVTDDDDVTLSYVKASSTTLTASTTSTNVTKEDAVTLTCTVDGYPAPSDPILTKDGTTPITLSCIGTNTKSCTKVFDHVQYGDSGTYKCSGSNTIDEVEKTSNDSLTLTVSLVMSKRP